MRTLTLPRLLPAEERISLCVTALRETLPVEEIWLFGSQAAGGTRWDSDIDLLVVLPDNHGIERPQFAAARAISDLNKAIFADVIVMPLSRFEEREGQDRPFLADEALSKGKRLYVRAR